jgi:hypothetical protein
MPRARISSGLLSNRYQGGGNKKQGLPPSVGLNSFSMNIIQRKAGYCKCLVSDVCPTIQTIDLNNIATFNQGLQTYTLNGNYTINKCEQLIIPAGIIFSIDGFTLTNRGTIENINGGIILNINGGIINNTNGSINNTGGSINNVGIGSIINNTNGSINNTGGIIINITGGSINNTGGVIDNITGGTINNTSGGSINNTGGTINNTGGIYLGDGINCGPVGVITGNPVTGNIPLGVCP